MIVSQLDYASVLTNDIFHNDDFGWFTVPRVVLVGFFHGIKFASPERPSKKY